MKTLQIVESILKECLFIECASIFKTEKHNEKECFIYQNFVSRKSIFVLYFVNVVHVLFVYSLLTRNHCRIVVFLDNPV